MGVRDSGRQECIEPFRLSRREIIEELVRLGVRGLWRIKTEYRSFERYWEARMAGSCDEERNVEQTWRQTIISKKVYCTEEV